MAKLPYMPFYVADWTKDTRGLPDFVRGIWIDIIVYLWDVPKRGTDTLPVQTWAEKCGTTETNMILALDTLTLHRTCNIVRHADGLLTVTSRRMIRDEKARKLQRKRQARYKAKRCADATLTVRLRSADKESQNQSHISESESEEEEKEREEKIPPIPPEGEWVVARWNGIVGVVEAKKITGPIRKRLATRLREHPDPAWWDTYLTRIADSDFLCGRKTDFAASLDWVLGPVNMAKILAGNYDNRPSTAHLQQAKAIDEFVRN